MAILDKAGEGVEAIRDKAGEGIEAVLDTAAEEVEGPGVESRPQQDTRLSLGRVTGKVDEFGRRIRGHIRRHSG